MGLRGKPIVPHRDDCLGEMKLCSKCARWLPLVEFYMNRANWDGLTTACRSCLTAQRHANSTAHNSARQKKRAEARAAAGKPPYRPQDQCEHDESKLPLWVRERLALARAAATPGAA
jgi:hypothetical protein